MCCCKPVFLQSFSFLLYLQAKAVYKARQTGAPVSHSIVDTIRSCSNIPPLAAEFFTLLMSPDPETRPTAKEACEHVYCALPCSDVRVAHLERFKQQLLTLTPSPDKDEAGSLGSGASSHSAAACITRPQQAGISASHSYVSSINGSQPIRPGRPFRMLHWLYQLARQLRLPQGFSLIRVFLIQLFGVSRTTVFSPSVPSDADFGLWSVFFPSPVANLLVSHPSFASADSAADSGSAATATSAQGPNSAKNCSLLTGPTCPKSASTSSGSFADANHTGSSATYFTSAHSSRHIDSLCGGNWHSHEYADSLHPSTCSVASITPSAVSAGICKDQTPAAAPASLAVSADFAAFVDDSSTTCTFGSPAHSQAQRRSASTAASR